MGKQISVLFIIGENRGNRKNITFAPGENKDNPLKLFKFLSNGRQQNGSLF